MLFNLKFELCLTEFLLYVMIYGYTIGFSFDLKNWGLGYITNQVFAHVYIGPFIISFGNMHAYSALIEEQNND
jgi:hypothetical protein